MNQGEGITHLQRRVILLTLMYCGIRVSELGTLKVTNVEVERNGKPIKIRIMGKGSKERIIPIPEVVIMPIWDWMLHRKRLKDWDYSRQYNRPKAYVNSPFLIPGTKGDVISHNALYKTVRNACKNADITVVSPHKLRHTFATNLLKKNTPLSVIQKVLGHASVSTTQVYTHVEDSDVEKWMLGSPDEKSN